MEEQIYEKLWMTNEEWVGLDLGVGMDQYNPNRIAVLTMT
jgi:hypothetical protein